jgi:hypothetical protein
MKQTKIKTFEHPTMVLGRLLRCWQELAIPPPSLQ